jgi:hypothetical protein
MLGLFATELAALISLVVWKVHKYASPDTPFVIKATVILAYGVAFSAFIGISADVYNSLSPDKDKQNSLRPILEWFWLIFYWLSLILNM